MKTLSSLVSLALVLVSPGTSWAAAVGRVNVRAGGAPVRVSVPAGNLPLNMARPGLAAPTLTPTLSVAPRLQVQAAAAAPVAAPMAAVAERASALAEQAAAPIAAVNEAPVTDSGAAYDSGLELEAIVTGRRMQLSDGGVFAGASYSPSLVGNESGFLAKPAGDSIRQAAESAPHGPTPPNTPNNHGGGTPPGGNGPLLPKLIAVAVALVPAAVLGWPLLAAGAYVYGGLVAAGSVSLASMVFMTERTAPLVRALPGVVIGALGLAAMTSSFAALPLTMGALVALGGWGFTRFARKDIKDRNIDSRDVIATFFGALAAITGAGLAVSTLPAWAAFTVVPVAYLGSALLLMHLPGWVGRGIESAARNALTAYEGVYKVQTSLRRDTSLYERLRKFSNAAIDASPWNAVWVGIGLWLPVLASELVQLTLTAAAGTVLAVAQAPLMFVAGASQSAYFQGAATATWNMAQGSKTRWFNAWERRFIPAANSGSVLKRLPAALAIRLGQWAWLGFALVTGTLGQLAAFFTPAEGKREFPRDPNSENVPDVPKPEFTTALPGKLIATAIAAAPVWYFSGALGLGAGPLGWLVLGAGALTALMPLTKWGGRLAALLMTTAGGWALFEGGRVLLMASLPLPWILAAGTLALFAGLGLSNLIKKLNKERDDDAYAFGFAGAVGAVTALTAAIAGASGIVGVGLMVGGMALGSLLLIHLPSWLWRGAGEAFLGVFKPVRGVGRASRQLWSETPAAERVEQLYKKAFEGKHWTYAIGIALALALPWAVTELVLPLVEWLIAVAGGLVIGATRIPLNFIAGARETGWWTKLQTRVAELQEKGAEPKTPLQAAGRLLWLAATTALFPLTWAYAAITVK